MSVVLDIEQQRAYLEVLAMCHVQVHVCAILLEHVFAIARIPHMIVSEAWIRATIQALDHEMGVASGTRGVCLALKDCEAANDFPLPSCHGRPPDFFITFCRGFRGQWSFQRCLLAELGRAKTRKDQEAAKLTHLSDCGGSPAAEILTCKVSTT